MYYKSKKKPKFFFILTINQIYQYIILLLFLCEIVRTYSFKLRSYRETNLLNIDSSNDINDLSNVQFLHPIGNAQTRISSG